MAQWSMISMTESFAHDCARTSRRSETVSNWKFDQVRSQPISLGNGNFVTVCRDCPTERRARIEFSTSLFMSEMRHFHGAVCSKTVYKTAGRLDVLRKSG